MEKQQNVQDNTSVEEKLPLDEEKKQEIVQQIRDLLAREDLQPALALFNQLYPADQGDVLEDLSVETQQELLTSLSPEEAADILEHMEPEDVARVSEGVDTSVLSDILDETSPDVAADILKQLPEEQSQAVLSDMEEAEEVAPLLQYPDDSAGGRMALAYVAVKEDMSAASALDILRLEGPEAEDIRSIFVVDPEKRLVGSLSLTRLALSRPTTMVRDIMEEDIISVASETNQEECARVMEHHGLDQLPVVDEEKRLIGVILSEDVLEVVEEEATEDMYRLAGIAGERVFGPLRKSVRNRLPWLSLNLVTTFMAAAVISLFESTIARVVALAVFLPVVAGQGGIGGTQTLTLVVRSMALGEIAGLSGLRLLAREVFLGIVHGLLLGVLVGIVAYFWKGNYMLGVVLGTAMLGNMLIAGLTGAGIPLLLRRIRVDPAVASAVFVTTCTDVVGFFLFLGLATALVSFLL